jgi:diadenosine tetraphosphate (Ap4A) HIT family hydrolase
MVVPGCDFCAELNGQGSEIYPVPKATESARVVERLGGLRMLPSLGEIVQGHLLIVPTYHVTASTNFSDADKANCRTLVKFIQSRFSASFGEPPVFFEHGDPTGKEMLNGQCVEHAHVHALPKYANLLPEVRRSCRLLGVAGVGKKIDLKEPYVAILDANDEFNYFSAADAPRQYLRALYAKMVGREGAENWFANVDIDKTNESVRICREVLAGLEGARDE